MKLTKAQIRALQITHDNGLDSMRMIIFRIQYRTVWKLGELGLIKYAPYAKNPHWRITSQGKEIIRQQKDIEERRLNELAKIAKILASQ